MTRPRERLYALAAVVAVQLCLGFALLTGLRVDIRRSSETVLQLIAVTLSKSFGLADTRKLVLPHPVGGTDEPTLRDWVDDATTRIVALLTTGA